MVNMMIFEFGFLLSMRRSNSNPETPGRLISSTTTSATRSMSFQRLVGVVSLQDFDIWLTG